MKKSAKFSECMKYRYSLTRIWNDDTFSAPLLVFVGLNPSTADAEKDDPTIRRCIGFAKDWGYRGIVMLNIFAYRATNPREIKDVPDKIGKYNDVFLNNFAGDNNYDVIFCWGAFPEYKWRMNQVENIFTHGKPIALSKDGFPRHPLYLKKDLPNPHK